MWVFCIYYKNECENIKTKISININYKNEHGNFHFFSLYNPIITTTNINKKYDELSNNCLINNNSFLQDIIGDILQLKFQNSTFTIFCNKKSLFNKIFSYKAIISIDNEKRIHHLKQHTNIQLE